MATTTFSSRLFNQDTSRAKQAAKRGPVIITNRGRPAHVLLTIEHYQQITGSQASIVDLLAATSGTDVPAFEAPRLNGRLYRPADLR